MNVPSLWTLAWHAWALTPLLNVAAVLALCVYLVGVRRVRRGWPLRRTCAFAAGLAAVLVATESGYDAYDDTLLSVHMVQHLLLLEVAPLLLLGGQPAMLLMRASPPAMRPGLARGFRRLRPLTRPLACLAIFCAIVAGAHTPAFFDATVHDQALHELEHAAFLAAGLFVWWPVLDADPIPSHRLEGVRRLSYVVAAMVPMTLIGTYLDTTTRVVYAAYLTPAHALEVSPLADQRQAGAIMWVIGSLVMVVAGIWQTMAALVAEERREQARERRLDALAAREARLP